MPAPTRGRCPICVDLSDAELVELNLLLADPAGWPKNMFEGWKLPANGLIPAGFRMWGGTKLGQQWLTERGYDFSNQTISNHMNRHVTLVVDSALAIAQQAALEENGNRSKGVVAITPTNFRQFFQKGLAVSDLALDILAERILEAEKEGGTPLSNDLLVAVAALGVKLATSAAALAARKIDMEEQTDNMVEAMRRGSGPVSSPRIGHHRVHVIDGVTRPVRDEGRADRQRYNRKAEQDGSQKLPA